MTEKNDNDLEDSNSILIRLKQIQKEGKVTITHDDISIFYQFSDNSSSFAKQTTKYKRIITYDELNSLDSAIDLLKNCKDNSKDKNTNISEEANEEISKLYSDFQNCFEKAKELQNKIKILHNFGKTFVYEDYLFFDLIHNDKNIPVDIETLISNYRSRVRDSISNNQNQSLNQPSYPPFITPDNLLYFGSLLQRKKAKKILEIITKMFPSAKNEIISEAINNAMNKDAIIDPLKCSIQMFSSIYESLSTYIKYSSKSKTNLAHSQFDNHFKDLQDELLSYFYSHNFLVIKVDMPVETFHVIQIISALLYNDSNRIPYFYENFFCYEDSDINSYFTDFEKDKYQIQTQFSFIIHPELLSSHNQNILKEKIVSRMTPIPDMTLQKFIIITSSHDFVFGRKPDENVKNDKHYTIGETSIKVDSSLMRDYCVKNLQPFFTVQVYQSMNAGCGKTTCINQEIERITRNKDFNYNVSHHFIVDGNQQIPIESFKSINKSKNLIHLQFSDEIMEQGIKFWSYLYQLYTRGFVLPANGEPLYINELGNSLVLFEIPQLRGDNQPLKSFDDFPLPFSTEFPIQDDKQDLFKSLIPTKIGKTLVNPGKEFKNSKISRQYYKFGIDSVVKSLKNEPKEQINDPQKYIETMYNIIFNPKEDFSNFNVSFRKIGYIEKYLHKYTKLYVNSLKEINNNEFVAFFYLLTVSAFYAYNYLPKESIINNETKQKTFIGYGLTLLTVNDLFCDHVENSNKKIHFFTTKKASELFSPLKNGKSYDKFDNFLIDYEYTGVTPAPHEVLRNMFCSSEEYMSIVNSFKLKNPSSYISRTQMTLPTLFRSSILLSRIFLSQPIILSGDTGCGKTSSLMLLYEYFKLPINDKMYSLSVEVGKTLNCHGGVTTEDVINHLKEAPKSSKKHIIFFDELNTSPASSYIEHLLLNENDKYNSKFVFIGALNPYRRKNPISSNLTKVGLTQYIKGEEKKVNLIEIVADNSDDNKGENMSDMMYHVHRPQEATQDIIFDFNPICYQDRYTEEDKFYPSEERESIHKIIENVAENHRREVINNLQNYIDECITFIRILMNERAVISYRDIERTMIMYMHLYNDYVIPNNEKESDLPLITAIISFVLRLPNFQEFKAEDLDKNLDEDEPKCSHIFELVFDRYFNNEKDQKYGSFDGKTYTINSRDKLLSNLAKVGKIKDVKTVKRIFMTFIYQYTLDYLKDTDIWKFQATFIHIFIMDVCIKCKLPCFIIGMPGTSKSYAVELLKKHYKDKLYVSTYMSSRTSSPDGIKSQYYDATFKEISNKMDDKEDNFCVVFIDEMGNANINPSRPLKFLHGILDHGLVLNETGYSNKVATIGVSNYTMDFANMNRGVLVYTGLPDRDEIVRVFALEQEVKDKKAVEIDEAKTFIDHKEKVDTKAIATIFDNLWGDNMPKTIALRSIYNIRNLINKDKYNIHSVCRILRELFNSKRLGEGNSYPNLISQCPQNVVKSFGADKSKSINNMVCFLERISCHNTESNKSLSLFTKNYEAIEYFNLFLDNKFIQYIAEQIEDLKLDEGQFAQFKYHLFAEDFKKKPEQISQDALKNIIECISEVNQNILFIGNHPCFDSCLDLLNVPHDSAQCEREVTLGSGFSSKFKLTNTKFYIMMIANIDDLKNISSSENPFSFAFLDRTETIYLDWEIIGPYYLQYKYSKIKEAEVSDICKEITTILNEHANYNTTKPEILHSNIENLYNGIKKIKFSNEYLTKLIKERWSNGIKAVVLTKSKILEDIYLPSDKIPKELTLIENDTNIQDFEQLKKSIDKIEEANEGAKERLIIINCSNFDELHFAHLKTFFDQIQANNDTIKYNIFIVYYGIDLDKNPKLLTLSTFRWPILSMEDISIHPELETQVTRKKDVNKNNESKPQIKETKELIPMTSDEVTEMKQKLNNMDKDMQNRRCHYFFNNIFDNIIKFAEKDIKERSHNENLDIKTNYSNSEFILYTDFFKQVKEKFETDDNGKYFDINIDENSFISSRKSQIISQVYRILCNILQPFLVFRYGSQVIQTKSGGSDLDDFLLKCPYLDLSLKSFTKNSGGEPYGFLFLDFYEFLIMNNVQFDENMKKQKFIADRVLCAIGQTSEVQVTFEYIFYSHFGDTFNDKFIEYIADFKPNFEEGNKDLIFLQTIVDFYRLRSLAGLNISKHQDDYYWSQYINYCLFLSEKRKQDSPKKLKNKNSFTRDTLIKSIVEFNNRTIFDIFVSPVVVNDSVETSICKKLTSTNNFDISLETNDKAFQVYKAFNEDIKSLKSDERYNYIKQKLDDGTLTEENKNIILSMLLLYATSKWVSEKQDDFLKILNIVKGFNNDDISRIFSVDRDYKVEKYRLKQDFFTDESVNRFKSFGDIYKNKYRGLKWAFNGDCLIDEIQSTFSKGSNTNPEFRKWLFCGFDKDEPLSIVAFRRFLNSINDETRSDLVKILDPFFNDVRIFDLFINSINGKIKEDSPFPFNEITTDDSSIMRGITFNTIFKFANSADANTIYKIKPVKPLLAQIIWFHVAFNKPSKYPLLTLLIKESSFFIDFQVVPKIINTMVHIRHIFSYNPVYIPIILHCTSLFKNCDCKLLLYSLNYFNTKFVINEDDKSETACAIEEFEKIQDEIDLLEEFIKTNYSDSYEIIRHQSAYHQIGFILKIYFDKYNEIIGKVKEYSDKYIKDRAIVKLETIEASSILPNMLITNLTLMNTLLPLMHENTFINFVQIEEYMCKLFAATDCFKSPTNEQYALNTIFPLFKVSYNKGKDYIGYTTEDYKKMFLNFVKVADESLQAEKMNDDDNSSLNYHASVLSYFLHIYINKNDDDLASYMEVKERKNDLDRTHMNTYAHNLHYDLKINAENLIFGNETIKFEKIIKLYFKPNSMYPLQSIFKLLPESLRNEIRNFQDSNRDGGLKIIESEEELKKPEKYPFNEPHIEEEEMDDDEDII